MIVAVIALFFTLMIGIGIWASSKVKDSGDYFLGNKSAGGILTAFRFASTFESGAMMMGTPGMGYAIGYPGLVQGFMGPLGYFFSFRVFGQRIKVCCDFFDTLTVPELLEKRYNSRYVRLLASIAILIGLTGSVIAQFKAMGEVFSLVLNIDYTLAVFIGVAVVGIYSFFGGYVATLWTNLIQGVLMVFGAVMVFVVTNIVTFGEFTLVGLPRKLNHILAGVNPDMLTVTGGGAVPLALIIVMMVISLSVGIAMPQQTVVIFGMKDRNVAKLSLIICSFFSVTLLWCLMTSAWMAHTIIPPVDNPDQVIPTLVSHILSPFWAGFFLTGVLSAIMSTVGGLILVTASALSKDIFGVLAPDVYNKKPMFYDRLSVFLMVLIPLLIALNPPTVIYWIMVFSFGMIVITFLMPMLGCIFWKDSTKQGAIASMLVGVLVIPLWTVIGEPGIPALFLGLLLAPIAFFLVSLLTKSQRTDHDQVEALWTAFEQI